MKPQCNLDTLYKQPITVFQIPDLVYHFHSSSSCFVTSISENVMLCMFQGSGGVTIKKTNQALIIGIYDEPLTPGQCNVIVERLGDYLIDQGL